MTKDKKLPSVKVYFEHGSELHKRIIHLSRVTGISVSAIAGMAINHGLSAVEKSLLKVTATK